MTDAEQAYIEAAKALNAAAYAAIAACKDTTALPNINRHALRSIAQATNVLVDDGVSSDGKWFVSMEYDR